MLSNNLSPLQEEVVGLLQEEAAEIIQELSKIRRAGTDFIRNGGDVPTIQFVSRELIDFFILLEIAGDIGLFDLAKEEPEYVIKKKEKLKEWTNIPHSVIENTSENYH